MKIPTVIFFVLLIITSSRKITLDENVNTPSFIQTKSTSSFDTSQQITVTINGSGRLMYLKQIKFYDLEMTLREKGNGNFYDNDYIQILDASGKDITTSGYFKWAKDTDADVYYNRNTFMKITIKFKKYVTSLQRLFDGSGITSVDFSKFNNEGLTSIAGLFWHCHNLVTVDLSNIKTERCTGVDYLFNDCQKLTSVDISNNCFDPNLIRWKTNMFTETPKLIYIFYNKDTPEFVGVKNAGKYRYIREPKHACSFPEYTNQDITVTLPGAGRVAYFSLTTYEDQLFYTFNKGILNRCVENEFFKILENGKDITSSLDFQWRKETDGDLYYKGTSPKTITIRFKRYITSLRQLFNGSVISKVDFSKFQNKGLTSIAGLFWHCKNLIEVDLSYINTERCTGVDALVNDCSNLKRIFLFNNYFEPKLTQWTSNILTQTPDLQDIYYNRLTPSYFEIQNAGRNRYLVEPFIKKDDGYIFKFEEPSRLAGVETYMNDRIIPMYPKIEEFNNVNIPNSELKYYPLDSKTFENTDYMVQSNILQKVSGIENIKSARDELLKKMTNAKIKLVH